jgi:cytochrome c553
VVAFSFLEIALFPTLALAADLRNGKDINEVCATCHGEFGQGGKQGEYPRLAGQPAGFIENQLKLFRARTRQNMPMLPHTEQRELSDQDITDIAAYLAQIQLPTRLPPADAGMDGLERLLQTKKVLNIPRTEGDPATGEKIYNKECRSCHGSQGMGNAEEIVPMLSGQYINYLWRQVDKYIAKQRIHDPDAPDDDELLAEFSHDQLRDIFAYLSIADD